MGVNDSLPDLTSKPFFRADTVNFKMKPKLGEDSARTARPKPLRSTAEMSDSGLVSTMLSKGDPGKVKAMAGRCADDPAYRRTLPQYCAAAIKAVSLFGFKK